MKALAANLKTLYQCPAIWLWNIIGLLLFYDAIIDPLVKPVGGEGEFVEYLLVSFWLGLVTGSLVKESWGKPLAFCLPGHREVTRSTIFAIGAVANVLLSLLVPAYPGLDGPAALAGVVSAACLGMTVYLLTVSGMFLVVHAAAVWGIPIVIFGAVQDNFGGAATAMEEAALFHPVANALALTPIALVVWNRLGDRDVARRHNESNFMALQYLFNQKATARYTLRRKLHALDRQSKVFWRRIESLFLSQMNRFPAFSGGRHSRGSWYVAFGTTLSASTTAVTLGTIVVALLIVILGFAPPSADQQGIPRVNFIYVVPAFLGLTAQIPLYSTRLVPAGRREKFRACLSIGMLAGVIALSISAAIYAVSFAVGTFMPSLTFMGKTLHYLPMEQDLVLAPLLLLPLLLACQILAPKRAVILQTILLILGMMLAGVMPGSVLQGISMAGLAVPIALCWWLFVGTLHHYCYHQDLAIA